MKAQGSSCNAWQVPFLFCPLGKEGLVCMRPKAMTVEWTFHAEETKHLHLSSFTCLFKISANGGQVINQILLNTAVDFSF